MNKEILHPEVQAYISAHIHDDVNKIALGKSDFKMVTATELAGQIAGKKKSLHKLPTWSNQTSIFFPPLLSIEQSSSEQTAAYKSQLAVGNTLIDLTAGFGVDSYFFSQQIQKVWSCEINPELGTIAKHNAQVLEANNIQHIIGDGIDFLRESNLFFDTIYIDPARRAEHQKVFKLKDCTPDVTLHLDLFLARSKRILIKTSPLLDISAGLSELKNVSEIHIVGVKNECKELVWIIDQGYYSKPKLVCTGLNEVSKTLVLPTDYQKAKPTFHEQQISGYLYEPDVTILKSGAFNWVGEYFGLNKLHPQSQLYVSETLQEDFMGRVFRINAVLSLNELKKDKNLIGNVIVRNFPEKAENLAKKYKIKPSHDEFILFSQTLKGYIVIKATIIQHY